MKIMSLCFWSGSLVLAGSVLLMLATASSAQAAPKKVLVVTVTKGFRHSSIPTAEKVLAELAKESGAFTVEYARVEPKDPQFQGPDGKPDNAKVDAAIKAVLAEKMSPAALKQYDAVIFANTTGDLPLPDNQAFLDWLKSGKGFIGMHAATDTFHNFQPYIEMIGGEFQHHGPKQGTVDVLNEDQGCPICRHLEADWKVLDEIYQFKNFDPAKVHGLLSLDKNPETGAAGHYPISWCKEYGKGRVFYTSLGHREDVWDPNTPATFKRQNSKEVAQAYQKHILEGIKWALGLENWTPKSPAHPE
jgi:type 1 glutamine amidotransferase